ncbi:UDP-glucuronosyltransferase 2C1-like [Asterias rubens]|uniref:UDP-glucuronosyltransferase 2C1-like n=1 Tax=Asterias rubens TaxID=7604 RepID=UPI00145562D3|nr:UDP-glucuronosyltransferase 2C1-like [Asterias rubens]
MTGSQSPCTLPWGQRLLLFVMVMTCINIPCAESKNILIVDSLIGGSHYQLLTLIGKDLAEKGHNITVLLGDCMLSVTDPSKHKDIFHFEMYDCQVTTEEVLAISNLFGKLSLTGELSSFTWYVKLGLGISNDPDIALINKFFTCGTRMFAAMKDTHHDRLKATNFDLVVCDNFSPWCSVLAHDILDRPYVNVANGGFLGTRYSRWGNTPSPMSYVPEYITHFTDSMTFLQRLRNHLMHLLSLLVYDVMNLSTTNKVRGLWGNQTSLSTREIMGASSLYIMNWDFHLEYPRPMQQNVVLCGGMSVTEAKPLSQEFETFVQGSGDEGVLVFSVSTLVNIMDDKMADMIAGALARLPFRVIWKYMSERRPATLGNNTMLASWIPQNDLLGHNKTRLFVFHGGVNGAYEAIFHGVPVVGIPLFADQVDNMLRLRSRGMAEYFEGSIQEVTTDGLYEKIMKVATNPSYKENAECASARFRSQSQSPRERAGFWIEHVMAHGGEHLHSNRGDMAWVQLNLLDIAAALIAVSVALVLMLRYWCTALSKEVEL